jgi:DNA modification methylase
VSVRVLVGSALDVLRTLEAESVQACVTSPPFYQLRDYGVDGQIGLEETPEEFLEKLWAVFDEVRRVLRKDGLAFVNLNDSYSGSGKGPTTATSTIRARPAEERQGFHDTHEYRGIPPKNLLLIPQKFAIGMQERGWIVRQEIVCAKKSCMPESVRDRFTRSWEPVWMFSKSARYFFDQEAVRVPVAREWNPETNYRAHREGTSKWSGDRAPISPHAGFKNGPDPGGANMRDVWHVKQPMLRLRSDLTPEQRAYVLRRLSGGTGRVDHA